MKPLNHQLQEQLQERSQEQSQEQPQELRPAQLAERLRDRAFTLDSELQLSVQNQPLIGQQLLRHVPGKRLVFRGEYRNTPVIIKLFVHKKRAKVHWQRELDGAQRLLDKQILTPDIIFAGRTDEAIEVLIFEYVQGESLAQFWNTSRYADKLEKLKACMQVLTQHHNAALAHQDLHYANFYLSQSGEIYTLDGEEVKVFSRPLNINTRLKNLAVFLAQSFDIKLADCLLLLEHYARLNTLVTKGWEDYFLKLIKHHQNWRIKHYLKKIFRDCTDVVTGKSVTGKSVTSKSTSQKSTDSENQSYSFLLRREYDSPQIRALLQNPEHYFNADTSVFLKQGNTCTVKRVNLGNEELVIKRYNPKGAAYELSHKGRMSRARKSWKNAHLLRFMGIATPAPVAVVEYNNTLGKRRSYFITRYQPGEDSWTFFCSDTHHEQVKQRVAQSILNILDKLAQYRITHGDLKGSNFIIYQEQVYLIDLDAMKQHPWQRGFKQQQQKDHQRFLKNWDKKSCYQPWKAFFNSSWLGRPISNQRS